ncbi:MAG: glycoside hydrolase family 3 protein [Sphingomonas sp.]|nr:MAG: glycoside hydrolase family 3 protein [Sphingomonas sp.]
MKRFWTRCASATIIATVGLTTGAPAAGGRVTKPAPAPASAQATAARARADAIVARMTIDEKIALLHGLFPPMAAGKSSNELIPSAGHVDGIARLGVPLVRESDASLGVANQVEQRKGDVATALPSGAAFRMSDLLAFEIAIEKGQPGSVMCAYNKVGGDWACENGHLLNDVLKRDWGYHGWVMSDWGAVHSTVKAANGGLDQQSGQELDKAIYFGAPLKAAVAAGQVSGKRLDDMVARYLTGLIATGAYDTPMPATAQTPPYAAHAEVAQRAAEAGIVLLKNEGGVLPIARTAKRIVVIGGNADVGVLSGGGSSQVRSVGGAPVEIPLATGGSASFARITYHASSPLAALRKALPGAQVTWLDGRNFNATIDAAKGADLAIVFATQWTTEAEDVPDLRLPNQQDALIAAVAAAQPHIVAVMETGGPVLMPWIKAVPAVVQAWYPGQRGGEALAAILTGAVNPSGRLPITFPADASQPPRPRPVGLDRLTGLEAEAAANPAVASQKTLESFPADYVEGADVGYRWYEKKGLTPLFRFGHGLSYTSFAYRNPVVAGGARLTVTFDVVNTGQRAGADVPQMYVAREDGGAPMRLAAFTRVTLKPGETRRVTLTAEPRIVADYDTKLPGWRIAAGRYRVALARDAGDRTIVSSATLQATTMKP